MNEHSFFILLPDTLAQQSQQCCHKAKSGKLFSYMSNKLVNRIQLWFDSLRQTNSHCSTEDKFECSGLAISQSRYCSYSGSAWHLVDDISRCSSSRGSVSRDEEAPVETCSCWDMSRSLLEINFRPQKHCSSVLVLLGLTMVYLARVSTCPCSQVALNSVSRTGLLWRLVEENRPKTSVHWKKVKT